MNVLSALKTYAEKWEVKEVGTFDQEEIAAILKAEVVPSEYGLSIKMTLKSGGAKYVALDRDSKVVIGEIIDLTKVSVKRLERNGEKIFRVLPIK